MREMSMPLSLLLNGMMALGLSLLMWRLTGSVLAWAILFGPGAILTLIGTIRAMLEALER